MTRQQLTFLLVSIIVMSACKEKTAKKNALAHDSIPVRIMPIRQDSIQPVFQTSGHFTTGDETPLSFKNGGIVQHIYVDEGAAIKAGQLLATVYAADVSAALSKAQLQVEKTQRDYTRAVNLYRDSVATLEQKQNAKTALQAAQHQVELAQFNQKHSEIRALHDGYVLERYLNEGQMAGPGTPVFLVNSPEKGQWKFKTDVSAQQWASIRIGDSATVTIDAVQGVLIPAKVVEKSESVNPKTGGFTLKLVVENTTDLPLATGLFGEAKLYSSQQKEVWQIPFGALLDGHSNSAYVFVTNDKKHAQRVKVHVSEVHHDNVIVDSGLAQAKYLIISGSAYLEDGAVITLINP